MLVSDSQGHSVLGVEPVSEGHSVLGVEPLNTEAAGD